MSRRLSLNARLAHESEYSGEIEVVLFLIEHPDLEAPIRLSTDNAVRFSVDPEIYCTLSTWKGASHANDPWLWIIASAVLPGDAEDAPAQATLVLENLDAGMVEIIRSFTTPATVSMAVVMADSPDHVEAEWSGLQIVSAEITGGEIVLALSRDEIELEPFPSGRLIKNRFPGLHL
ncbi:hypothetical protein F8A10_12200 [Paracoccus kondratievae]|uniref:hypothetical protein n=1 Tax=Paracoccus kondratievae TaxID=135740 RepID=UPI0012660AE8|nr:hypothetical protein [Paracoccus kondratievae]QFQ88272.1 hypothetical protein F8A10_12200 [Paracoccus kondratievae]